MSVPLKEYGYPENSSSPNGTISPEESPNSPTRFSFAEEPQSTNPICAICNEVTANIPVLSSSAITYIWGALCLLTCCCCVPFCVDSCKDVKQVCGKCHNVKSKSPGKCCWQN